MNRFTVASFHDKIAISDNITPHMTIKTKSIEQKFRKLTEVEHVLARPGRYIGSIAAHKAVEWIPTEGSSKPEMSQREATYNPGFLKLFDEVISNSADEAKLPGSKLDIIRVEVDKVAG